MKRRFFATGFFLLAIALSPVLLNAQYLTPGFGQSFQMEDIRSIVLEDFENNDRNWHASASRFTAEGFPQLKFGIEGVPLAVSSSYGGETNRYVMGIRAAFTRKGYNSISIYPEEEIVIPGYVKKLDVWVWGANYYYNLEVHLRDYRGVVHKFSLGSLHYMGWKNLSLEIPGYIPQFIRYLPMEKPLTLVRFVVWTEPTERVDDYMIYFDRLKVLTDLYKQRFDGDILADKSREIWGKQ